MRVTAVSVLGTPPTVQPHSRCNYHHSQWCCRCLHTCLRNRQGAHVLIASLMWLSLYYERHSDHIHLTRPSFCRGIQSKGQGWKPSMRLPSSAFPNVPKPGAQGLQLSSKWVSVNHRCRNDLLNHATLRAFLGYLLGYFLLQVRVEGTSPLAIKSSNQKQHLTPIMTHVSVIQKNSMVPYNNYEPVIWGLGGVQACESHCHQWGGGFLRHRACRGILDFDQQPTLTQLLRHL